MARDLLNREWQVKLSHIYRESNKVADWLAGHAVKMKAIFKRKEIM
ncbi:ribonuclease H [Senna tora]|uniref:Ribonuclease H n=1 Tax=Senna tora TaxID=362788 RepID=A0A834U2U3_9FABA|nr:ribonuclease H [Senna tora]